jgi:subtilisin family serine protease
MILRRLASLTFVVAFAILCGCAQSSAPPRVRLDLVEPTNSMWQTKYWGLDVINAISAWQRVPDASAVTVAVVDSGLAPHPDIVNTQPGGTQCPSGTWNQDEDGHGTRVAGIIAGKPTGSHAVGVAWFAMLRGYRFLCPSAFFEDTARNALRAALAAAPAPAVVNASWAHLPWETAVATDIDALVTGNPGVLFVFAAPPAAPPYPPSPAPHPYPAFTTRDNVIIVTASDQDDRLLRSAGRDPARVHIAAPGVAIATADVRPSSPGTTTFQGASAAAAFVSGCAALVKRAAETATSPVALTGAQIREYLLKYADSKPTLRSGVIDGKRLNCGAAVLAVPR